MTDRELLELAAKAARYQYAKHGGYIVVDGIPGNWNPLTDDGDALRLAVKLRLHIEWRADGRVAVSQGDEFSGIYEMESSREDVLAATRRAITRAAAQIQLDKDKK